MVVVKFVFLIAGLFLCRNMLFEKNRKLENLIDTGKNSNPGPLVYRGSTLSSVFNKNDLN